MRFLWTFVGVAGSTFRHSASFNDLEAAAGPRPPPLHRSSSDTTLRRTPLRPRSAGAVPEPEPVTTTLAPLEEERSTTVPLSRIPSLSDLGLPPHIMEHMHGGPDFIHNQRPPSPMDHAVTSEETRQYGFRARASSDALSGVDFESPMRLGRVMGSQHSPLGLPPGVHPTSVSEYIGMIHELALSSQEAETAACAVYFQSSGLIALDDAAGEEDDELAEASGLEDPGTTLRCLAVMDARILQRLSASELVMHSRKRMIESAISLVLSAGGTGFATLFFPSLSADDELKLARRMWYEFSRATRFRVFDRIADAHTVLPAFRDWADARDGVPTFVTDLVVNNGHRLMAPGDTGTVEAVLRDLVMLSNDYFTPAGPRFYAQLEELEAFVHGYITAYALQIAFPMATEHYESALFLTKLVTSPALQLASMMPSLDVDPPASLVLATAVAKTDLAWAEVQLLFRNLRLVWPRTDMDARGIHGIDCLLLRFMAKSKYPLDQVDSSDEDPVDQAALLPLVIRETKELFKGCIARAKHTDLAALPMVIYRLLSQGVVDAGHFDFTALPPLLRLARTNFNWPMLDRAAKLRAATAVVPPQWWTQLRATSVVVRNLFPESVDSESAEFNRLVTTRFSAAHVTDFRDLVASGWLADASRTAVELAMASVLEFLVESIETTGDWLAPNPWEFVLSQFVPDYSRMLTASNASQAAFVRSFAERVGQAAIVAERHVRSARAGLADLPPSPDALALLFDAGTKAVSMAGWAAAGVVAQAGGAPWLTSQALTRMKETGEEKYGQISIDE